MTQSSSYAIVEIDQGALLLELTTGLILRLNRTATLVWQQHLGGKSPSEIADMLGERYGLPAATATRDAVVALEIPRGASPAMIDSEFRYEQSSKGYTYLRSGRPLLEINDQGTTISLSPGNDAARADMRQYLRNVAPKILSVRGHIVLHASAAVVGESVIAFAGPSGAGKTTTVRALVRAGARAISEDKLMIILEDGQVRVALNGESMINTWADRVVTELEAEQRASCESLDRVEEGPSCPLAELGFVDAGRRREGPVSRRRVGALDAAGTIFQRAFLGSDATSDWIRQLRASAAIARVVAAYELEMPDDLNTLSDEARKIVANASLSAGPAGEAATRR